MHAYMCSTVSRYQTKDMIAWFLTLWTAKLFQRKALLLTFSALAQSAVLFPSPKHSSHEGLFYLALSTVLVIWIQLEHDLQTRKLQRVSIGHYILLPSGVVSQVCKIQKLYGYHILQPLGPGFNGHTETLLITKPGSDIYNSTDVPCHRWRHWNNLFSLQHVVTIETSICIIVFSVTFLT